MRPITLAVALLVSLVSSSRSQAQQAVYLVRHAEKLAGGQDGLTDEGTAHAQALARVLKDAKVKAIYTSEFQRTRQTAQPLADALGLTPVVVSRGDPAETFRQIRADHPGDVVLVVGHSNTIPALIKRWDASLAATIDDATEFDRLFVLVPTGETTASLGRLRYRKED